MPRTVEVIGLGSAGTRHAKNLLALGCEVYGYDIDPNARTKALRAGIPVRTTPNMGSTDAVVIATPTSEHYRDLLTASLMPDGPIFVEKPLADRMIDLPTNLRMVGYNLRFHSCVKKAKEWLDIGHIGRPLWANLTVAQCNDKYEDSVILNWSHEIDLALYLLGQASVKAAVSDDRIADLVLKHGSGCQTTVHLDYVTAPEIRNFAIAGTRGNMHVDLVRRTAWINNVDHFFKGRDSFNENYVEEMQAFLDRIDGAQTIGCTGEEGLAVLEICLVARKMAGLT